MKRNYKMGSSVRVREALDWGFWPPDSTVSQILSWKWQHRESSILETRRRPPSYQLARSGIYIFQWCIFVHNNVHTVVSSCNLPAQQWRNGIANAKCNIAKSSERNDAIFLLKRDIRVKQMYTKKLEQDECIRSLEWECKEHVLVIAIYE